jgi:hypothetical protein
MRALPGSFASAVSTRAAHAGSCALTRARDAEMKARRPRLERRRKKTTFPIVVRPATDCRDVPERGTGRAQIRFPTSVGPFPSVSVGGGSRGPQLAPHGELGPRVKGEGSRPSAFGETSRCESGLNRRSRLRLVNCTLPFVASQPKWRRPSLADASSNHSGLGSCATQNMRHSEGTNLFALRYKSQNHLKNCHRATSAADAVIPACGEVAWWDWAHAFTHPIPSPLRPQNLLRADQMVNAWNANVQR